MRIGTLPFGELALWPWIQSCLTLYVMGVFAYQGFENFTNDLGHPIGN